MSKYNYNVNKYCIEKDKRFFAYVNIIDANRIVKLLNEQDLEINQLKRIIRQDYQERKRVINNYVDLVKEKEERIRELEQENECLKDALSERGVSDIKCYGKRIDTGLFDDDGDKV